MYCKILVFSIFFISFSSFAEDRDLVEETKDRGDIRSNSDAPAWNIDVENDAHYCYRTAADLVFWRSSEDETVVLSVQTNNMTKQFRWLADTGKTVNWFKSIPISDNETYLVTMGEVTEHQLSLHQTSGDIKQMREYYCHRQAGVLEKTP